MKKYLSALFLLCAVILCSSSSWAVSQDWKLVVRVKGVVESQFSGEAKWERIWQNRLLHDGDKTRTGADSRAIVRLVDNSYFTLGENTEVEVSKFQLTQSERELKMKLTSGKLRSSIGKFTGKKNQVEVQTPNAVMAARGTEFYVEYDDKTAGPGAGGVTRLIVFESSVEITSNGVTQLITAGNSAEVGPAGNIMVNPPGLEARSPGFSQPTTQAPDVDLVEFDPTVSNGTVSNAPSDPYIPNNSTQVTGGGSSDAPAQTGVFVPPPGNTGSIIVIIK
ncbi:MAG: FecR family protein [Firmicutes bacterium]|nr:FecR family protein [Bacillota bacterium]